MNIRTINKRQALKLEELSLIESEDSNAKHMCEVHFRKHGQLRIPTIAVVDKHVRVVDGMKYTRTILKLVDEIKVNYVGEMSLVDFMALRIYHNFQNQRVHYINMADFIGKMDLNKIQRQSIANNTSLTENEVKRYQELLTFDFEEFRRTDISTDQQALF